MRRPTFILAEPEPQEALSTRKLILETAKFNVITAYSASEIVETLKRFPDSDAVILHDSLAGSSKAAVSLKKLAPQKKMIILASGHGTGIKGADHAVNSHEPNALLSLLRQEFGDPRPKPNGHARKKST